MLISRRLIRTIVLVFLLSGCDAPAPRALIPGVDLCADCHMTVGVGGHGAQLVSATGRVYVFDSVECLINHLASASAPSLHSVWVTDFTNPGNLVPAESAFYLISSTLASPMGLGVTAFATKADRDTALEVFGGAAMEWASTRRLVEGAWPEGRPMTGSPHGGHSEVLVQAG